MPSTWALLMIAVYFHLIRREYKVKIEDELLEICNDILSIIETELIPNSTNEEGRVFYFKMKGDYHRYTISNISVRQNTACIHDRIRLFSFLILKLHVLFLVFRYLAEFQVGEKRRASSDAALSAYKSATEIAEHDLPPTHPIRLGLALNFSVFYYEIYNSPVGVLLLSRFSNPLRSFRTQLNLLQFPLPCSL